MTEQSLDESQDAALHVYRVFQDLLKSAVDKKDMQSVRAALNEFNRLFRSFLEQPGDDNVEMSEAFLRQTQDPAEQSNLKKQIEGQKKRREIRKRLTLAHDQVLFALAARTLNQFLVNAQDASRKELFDLLAEQLPQELSRLTNVLDSLQGDPTAHWGWDWWDMPADGEAHFVDAHTKPNQLYCVAALRQLAGLDEQVVNALHLPHSHSFAFLADPNNGQGLVKTLEAIRDHPDLWSSVLTQAQLVKIPALLQLLARAKQDDERHQEDQLIAAPLAPEKIEQFKATIVDSARRFGRMKPLLDKYGMLRREQATEADVPSWGYNQIDEKGAFVRDVHTSYVGWGEAYGRGLGQTEDHRAFAAMVASAGQSLSVTKTDLISGIEEHVRSGRLRNPVVLQTLGHVLEFEEIRRKELFLPRYHRDCPPTPITGLDGFMGVFRFNSGIVPIFDVFVQGADVADRAVLADLSSFVRMHQYPPVDEAGDGEFVTNFIFIRVRDLNSEDALRERILTENPTWLQDKADKERYLRSHVTVNVYEKIKFEAQDGNAGICFSITQP